MNGLLAGINNSGFESEYIVSSEAMLICNIEMLQATGRLNYYISLFNLCHVFSSSLLLFY